MRKNCSSDQEKLLKFEAEGQEFAKFVRSLDQFLQTVEGQIIFFSRVPNMTGVLNKSVGRISKKIIKKYQIRL